MTAPITIDFETFGIETRPDYPPKPVGVAIYEPGEKPRYLAWGHPRENNCKKSDAAKELRRIWKSGNPVLFHHGKFDLDVARVHFKLPLLPVGGYHDTLFLAFLNNPHDDKLALKLLAEKYLGMPPEEQNALHDWILAHVRTTEKSGGGEVRIVDQHVKGLFKVPPTKVGKFIAYAPGKLVGDYAVGDVVRTRKLFNLFYKDIKKRDMLEAYQRDLDLMPILLEAETSGVRIHHAKLRRAVKEWETSIDVVDTWLQKKFKRAFNVDSGEELADALEAAGYVDDWVYTEKGNRSVAKDNIIECINDKRLTDVLLYRGTLSTLLKNFGRPWLRMADVSGGLIYTNWNQVRQTDERGKGGKGARTGRLSSNPNFQNIPKLPKNSKPPKLISRVHGVCDLPFMREFIAPWEKGHVLVGRDYSQQELRVLGHFEDGVLLKAYQLNPNLDVHELARKKINAMLHTSLERRPIKDLGFGLIYGMGLGLLATKMELEVRMAKQVRDAYLAILPGLKDLIDDLKERARAGEPLRTWGGREYYVEEPKVIKGRLRTFEYKLLNVLIQGSSADCTKQAMINFNKVKHRDTKLLLNVHDEILISTPKALAKQEMTKLREAMLDVAFDVPMISDGKTSLKSWGHMKEYKE